MTPAEHLALAGQVTRGPADVGESVLGRAFRVLDAYGPHGHTLTLSEVARAAGLPKSTTHRIVCQLVGFGALERVGDYYRLGTRLFELGSLVPHPRLLRAHAQPILEDLYEATHETVQLGVLDDLDVLFVDRISGRRVAPAPVNTQIGDRLPALSTTLGRALIAFSAPEALDALIESSRDRGGLHGFTTTDEVRRELATVAQRGVAIDGEAGRLGMACIAAPVFQRSAVVAAISITGPTHRLDRERAVHLTRVTAGAISRALDTVTRRVAAA